MSALTKEQQALVLRNDPFAEDFGEPGDRTLSDKIVTARKVTQCGFCWAPILPGTHNRVRVEISDGQMMRYRWCEDCCVAMAKLATFGDAILDAALDEDLDEDPEDPMEVRFGLRKQYSPPPGVRP